jgi:hypothetical protein
MVSIGFAVWIKVATMAHWRGRRRSWLTPVAGRMPLEMPNAVPGVGRTRAHFQWI